MLHTHLYHRLLSIEERERSSTPHPPPSPATYLSHCLSVYQTSRTFRSTTLAAGVSVSYLSKQTPQTFVKMQDMAAPVSRGSSAVTDGPQDDFFITGHQSSAKRPIRRVTEHTSRREGLGLMGSSVPTSTGGGGARSVSNPALSPNMFSREFPTEGSSSRPSMSCTPVLKAGLSHLGTSPQDTSVVSYNALHLSSGVMDGGRRQTPHTQARDELGTAVSSPNSFGDGLTHSFSNHERRRAQLGGGGRGDLQPSFHMAASVPAFYRVARTIPEPSRQTYGKNDSSRFEKWELPSPERAAAARSNEAGGAGGEVAHSSSSRLLHSGTMEEDEEGNHDEANDGGHRESLGDDVGGEDEYET